MSNKKNIYALFNHSEKLIPGKKNNNNYLFIWRDEKLRVTYLSNYFFQLVKVGIWLYEYFLI